jgi:hypothetical protein
MLQVVISECHIIIILAHEEGQRLHTGFLFGYKNVKDHSQDIGTDERIMSRLD